MSPMYIESEEKIVRTTKPQIQRTPLLDISNVSSPRTHANKLVPYGRGYQGSGKLEGGHGVIGDYSTTILS